MNFVGCAWENGQNTINQQEDFTNAIFLKRKKIKKNFKTKKKSKMMLNRSYKGTFFILKDLTIIKKRNY